jgi:tRNA threonylcarbamoyladenosine biosynthesis protein TsaE
VLVLRVDSLAGTHAVAAAVAGLARTADIIVLAGEMGVGKTAFAQGFGRALGITEPITSPTFTLVHSYPFGHRRTLHHADLYRLDSTSDVDELALDELAEFGGIVLVEWGDVAAAKFGEHLEVRLTHDDGGDLDDDPGASTSAATERAGDDADVELPIDEPRTIEISAVGQSWTGRWERLCAAVAAFRV